MITDAIVGWVLAGLTALLTLLPTWTAPTGPSLAFIGGAVNAGDKVFPMTQLVWAILAGFAVEALLRLWDFSIWLYHQFWGSD